MSRVSAFVPVFDFGPSPERGADALAGQVPGIEIQIVGSDPDSLNRAVARSDSEILVFVPSFVEPRSDLIPALLRHAQGERVGLTYGDHEVRIVSGEIERQPMVASEDDLSEWSAVGYVRAIRRDAFEDVGGYDPTFRHAAEYDLRLRMSRRWRLARVDAVLCRIDQRTVPFELATVKADLRRYFTPESSPMGGIGYLRVEGRERREIERAFETELRARGAFLGDPSAPLRCPHGDGSPKVSVVIPVHDRADLVVRAIASVTSGTYGDVEILVVDGGSTDGTVDAVRTLAERRPEIRLLHSPENRIAISLNEGLRAARGKYVARLDSDDLYAPGTLERMIAHLERRPDEALAISYYDFVDREGRSLPDLGTIRHLEYDRNAILRTSGAGAVRVWHRCALDRLGGFDSENFGEYAEDYDMVLRVSERWAVGRVHEVLYRCRLHEANTSACLEPETRARTKALARKRALKRRIRRNDGVDSAERARRSTFA